jgi:hypothetical protein
MYGCIQNSLFSMSAEILSQIKDQDPDTNEILRRWVVLKSIKCSVLPIKETGASSTSDNKTFSKEYTEELEVKLHTSEQLSKRWRITNILNSDKKQLYCEIDRVSKPSTIFEVYASHPTFDIFGNIQYYENHIKRVSVQSND